MRTLVLLAVISMLAACSREHVPPDEPEFPLHTAVRESGVSQACGSIIPLEWAWSPPLPAIEGGKLVYKIFFFGRSGDPQKGFIFHHPEGDATIAADGRVTACSRRSGPVTLYPKWEVPDNVTQDDIDQKERDLYPQIADAAQLYASKRELTADEKKRIVKMADDFMFFVDKGQGPDYLALSPDFWTWVRKNGGRVPPAQ